MDRATTLSILIMLGFIALCFGMATLDPKVRRRWKAGWQARKDRHPIEEHRARVEQRTRERDERTARARAQGLPCCPYCGSTGISANKRGYKVGKGVLWGLLLGFAGFWLFAFVGFAIGLAIGLSFGSFGSGAVTCTCLSCGRRFRPGQRNP